MGKWHWAAPLIVEGSTWLQMCNNKKKKKWEKVSLKGHYGLRPWFDDGQSWENEIETGVCLTWRDTEKEESGALLEKHNCAPNWPDESILSVNYHQYFNYCLL